jgi:putative protein-disulfide isomerase
MAVTLYYIHDPMCSWCWAFREIYEDIVVNLPDDVKVKRLLGGLAADTEEDMSEDMQSYIKHQWQSIQEKLPGIEFNFDFWDKCKPKRATYSACRAVISANNQGNDYDEMMTLAIQQGYYLYARNPSDQDTLIAFANELNLNEEQFTRDLFSADTNETLKQQINLSRQLGAAGFPSMLLETNGNIIQIPTNYLNSKEMLVEIQNNLLHLSE